MKTLQIELLATALLLALLGSGGAQASPDPSPDNDADVVYLRVNCNENGSPKTNCFESMSAVTTWIWTTRTNDPSPGDEVSVEIGPGTFGRFACPNGEGYVTLRGSGREQTIIADADIGVIADDCVNLSFIDIAVEGGDTAVSWFGSGFSTWSDTDLVNTGEGDQSVSGAWSDNLDATHFPNFECGTHYFHGTRVRALGGGSATTSSFYSACGDNWFFGGEITTAVDTNVVSFADGVHITGMGSVHLFGTSVRVFIDGGSPPDALRGVLVNAGDFESYGSSIEVSSVGAANEDVIGIDARSSGTAEAHDTSWELTPDGSGDATRIVTASGGTVDAPFQWATGTAPPAIASENGEDSYVETDCESTDCTGGSEPHLMIYSTSCVGGGGPWFDTVRAACRVN